MVDILAAERPDDSVAAQLRLRTGSGEVSEVNATYDCHGNVAVRDRRNRTDSLFWRSSFEVHQSLVRLM